MAESSFPKSSRLLKASDYKAVFSEAKFKVSCRYFLVLAIFGSGSGSRLGLVVAKKNIPTAVQRNRIKRQIRDQFRRKQDLQVGLDLVVLVRKDADKLLNSQLSDKFSQLWQDLEKKTGNSSNTRSPN